jgi:hypothetical protein
MNQEEQGQQANDNDEAEILEQGDMTAFEINDKEFHNLLPDVKVDGFLQKPFSIQQLNNVVEKINTKTD